jgi:hypothetical protein
MTPEWRNNEARARQQLNKHVPAATNTQRRIKRLLGKGVFCWARPEAIQRVSQTS